MAQAIGVDIGGTKVLAGLIDEQGRVLHRVGMATKPGEGTATLLAALGRVSDRADAGDPIGIGAAGWVDVGGSIDFAPNVDFERSDLRAMIEKQTGRRVAVENDANAAAWAEASIGSGRGARRMLMLTVGTGIGGGIVIDGALYRGSRGYAAEFGHMTIQDGGPKCSCGQSGCFEAMASGTAIEREAAAANLGHDSIILRLAGGDPSKITGVMVSEAADSGEEAAITILKRAGYHLGVGLAALSHCFDPDLIVIGGGAAEAGRNMLEPARAELSHRFKGKPPPPAVVEAKLGNDAGLIGAALLAMKSE